MFTNDISLTSFFSHCSSQVLEPWLDKPYTFWKTLAIMILLALLVGLASEADRSGIWEWKIFDFWFNFLKVICSQFYGSRICTDYTRDGSSLFHIVWSLIWGDSNIWWLAGTARWGRKMHKCGSLANLGFLTAWRSRSSKKNYSKRIYPNVQALIKSLFTSCLLVSHWPQQVNVGGDYTKAQQKKSWFIVGRVGLGGRHQCNGPPELVK